MEGPRKIKVKGRLMPAELSRSHNSLQWFNDRKASKCKHDNLRPKQLVQLSVQPAQHVYKFTGSTWTNNKNLLKS